MEIHMGSNIILDSYFPQEVNKFSRKPQWEKNNKNKMMIKSHDFLEKFKIKKMLKFILIHL